MVKEWDLKSHGVSPRRFKSCSWRLFIHDNLTNNVTQEYTEISARVRGRAQKASEESHLLLVAQLLLRGWMMVDLVLILSQVDGESSLSSMRNLWRFWVSCLEILSYWLKSPHQDWNHFGFRLFAEEFSLSRDFHDLRSSLSSIFRIYTLFITALVIKGCSFGKETVF